MCGHWVSRGCRGGGDATAVKDQWGAPDRPAVRGAAACAHRFTVCKGHGMHDVSGSEEIRFSTHKHTLAI